MRPFVYLRAGDIAEAVGAAGRAPGRVPQTMAPAQFLAGGTTILDLMKVDVMRPEGFGGVGPAGRGIEERAKARFISALL